MPSHVFSTRASLLLKRCWRFQTSFLVSYIFCGESIRCLRKSTALSPETASVISKKFQTQKTIKTSENLATKWSRRKIAKDEKTGSEIALAWQLALLGNETL